MKSARRLEVAVSKRTVEDVINGEMTTVLRALGFFHNGEEVRIKLPGPDTMMLPIELGKEQIEEERLVCTVL